MYVDSTILTLPSDLLHAISALGGGRVVLVLDVPTKTSSLSRCRVASLKSVTDSWLQMAS